VDFTFSRRGIARAGAFITLIGAAAIVSGAAQAQSFSWTGFYFGGNAGGGWSSSTTTLNGNDSETARILAGTIVAGGTPASPISLSSRGPTVGLQAGYNHQIAPQWLVGVEADISASNFTGSGLSRHLVFPAQAGFSDIFLVHRAEQTIDWWGTFRGRLGFLPRNDMLLYATGGLAYGRVKNDVTVPNARADAGNFTLGGVVFGVACSSNTVCMAGSSSRIAAGWSVGGGGELALSQSVSVKVDYLYVNLGNNTVNVVALRAPAGAQPASYTADFGRADFHTVRLGINVKLDALRR
jgi:outer membrane immunogenic protein